MKRFALIGLAALFAVAAVIVAVIGLRGGERKPAAAPAKLAYSVVTVVAALPPGHVLRLDDLKTDKVSSLPVNSFPTPNGLAGRRLAKPAVAGQPLTRDMLAQSHPIATQLLENERAVAIQTNRIVGVGGHLRPGDRVDLLVQFGSQTETGGRTSAMLALSDLRVLAYENQLPEEPEVVGAKDGDEDKDKKDTDAKPNERRSNNPSVVLAVPADQATRLMLAVGTGDVRLALRPPVPEIPALAGTTPSATALPANAREAKQVTLSQLTFSKPLTAVTVAASLPPGVAPGSPPKVRATTQVEIFEGEKSRSVSFTKP